MKSAVHHVYRIDTPCGVYIGVTSEPDKRWCAHRNHARSGTRAPLYDAMREHGASACSFTVVGAARYAREEFECSLIRQAIENGEAVLNLRVPARPKPRRIVRPYKDDSSALCRYITSLAARGGCSRARAIVLLSAKSGISVQTISHISAGKPARTWSVAKALETATDGECTAVSMCEQGAA